MADEVLDLIDEIIRLRRQIKHEIEDLKLRMSLARIEKRSRFAFALQLRFDPIKSTFAHENLKLQAEIYTEIAAWGQANAVRSKSYGADTAAVGKAEADEKIPMLMEIRAACENEVANEIPKLRNLIIGIEELKRSYDEIVAR